VVNVQMREHDPLDVARRNAERLELRRRLLLGLHVEPRREAKIGMPARQPHQARGRARIDENDPFRMLDRIGVGREPVQPFPVDQRREPPRQTVTPADHLALLDLHEAGLNGMDSNIV